MSEQADIAGAVRRATEAATAQAKARMEMVSVRRDDLTLLRSVCALYAPYPPTDDIAGAMQRTLTAAAEAGPSIMLPANGLTAEQVAELRERFAEAMRNPGPLKVLPSDPWKDHAEAAEAKLSEVREVIATYFIVHGNSTGASLTHARDLAEGIRQILDRGDGRKEQP